MSLFTKILRVGLATEPLDPGDGRMVIDREDEIDCLVRCKGIMGDAQADPVAALPVHAMDRRRLGAALGQSGLEARHAIARIGKVGNADYQHREGLACHLPRCHPAKLRTCREIVRTEIGPALLRCALGDEGYAAANDFPSQRLAAATGDGWQNDGIERIEIGGQGTDLRARQRVLRPNQGFIRQHGTAMPPADRAEFVELGEIAPERYGRHVRHGPAELVHAHHALLAQDGQYPRMSLFPDHMISLQAIDCERSDVSQHIDLSFSVDAESIRYGTIKNDQATYAGTLTAGGPAEASRDCGGFFMLPGAKRP